MSAEHTDWLLKQLYEEETQDKTAPSHTGHTPSEEEIASLAQVQAFLDEVRPILGQHPAPPEAIKKGIFEAAHQEAASLARKSERRGAAPPSLSTKRSWIQAGAALAATMLCVFGAAIYLNQSSEPASKFSEASAPVAMKEVGFGNDGDAQAQTTPSDGVVALAQNKDKTPAQGAAEKAIPEQDLEAKIQEAEEVSSLAYKSVPKPRSRARSAYEDKDRYLKKKRSKRRAPATSKRPTTLSGKVKFEQALSDDQLSADYSDGADSKDRKERNIFGGIEQPNEERISGRGGEKELAKEPAPAPVVVAKKTAPRKNRAAAPSKSIDAAFDEAEAQKNVPSAPASAAPPADALGPGSMSNQVVSNLRDVERAWKSENYNKTLSSSERFLKSGVGTRRERARALEYKAKALSALGRGAEATQAYTELAKRYPEYYKKENVRKKPTRRKNSKAKKAAPDTFFEASEVQKAY